MKKGLFILFVLLSTIAFAEKKITLVIDPGHGGTDPGNLNTAENAKKEKDLNLTIAEQFGNYVDMYLGHQVEIFYTRKTDTFIALPDRVQMANNINADYFISIHCNSSPKKEVFGTETHVHNLESKKSLELARMIEKQFATRAGRNSRGVKLKTDRLYNLMVLRDSKMPAILVETGFMTNSEEEKYLNSNRGQDLIASAIFRSFRDFVKSKHDISMRTPNEITTVPDDPVWKIQIMASTGPVALTNPDFSSINNEIEEVKIEKPTNPFNYKYYVGNFTDKKDARALLKEIKDGVFKDSFLVKFE